MKAKAVFLDRDGVINAYVYNSEFGTVDSPSSPDEFTFCKGAPEAIADLTRLGFLIIVVSNQPGIAKGKYTNSLLDKMTRKMKDGVAQGGGRLDGIYYCLHHPDAALDEFRAHCDCRKPRPGLILRAAGDFGIDLGESIMIGDGITDIEAGIAAGTRTIFIGQAKPYVLDTFRQHGVQPGSIAPDLASAVERIKKLPLKNTTGKLQGNETAVGRAWLAAGSDAAPRTYRKGAEIMTYTDAYLEEAETIARSLDREQIEKMAAHLAATRERGGRLFILGVGGGAGHASHAVCDFRKIAGIEAYAPTDNVSELTARTNDDGWESAFANWMKGSRLTGRDLVMVFSVGGGDAERNISANLVSALKYARQVGAGICGIVGRDGGFTAQVADECVLVPVPNPATVTPHTESFQAVVWHLLASHPLIKQSEMKWESVK